MLVIKDMLSQVRTRIEIAEKKYCRIPGSVQLLAVSKTKSSSMVEAAIDAGQHSFGENYVQEAVDKIIQLRNYPLDWHYIGALQTNKTQQIARYFDWVHGVDRLKIARRLSDQRVAKQIPLNVCIQVNVDKESTKAGVGLDGLAELAQAVNRLANLRLRGLMVIPENLTQPAQHQVAFRALAIAQQTLVEENGLALDTLSMGMSADLEYAIAEGATWVRIGRAIFGRR